MAILAKKETLYPSITKPGIFYYDDENESLWEEYTGIDDSELNRFKFSIGSWQELRAQNRSIKLFPNEDMDYISSGLTGGTGDSTKPTTPPPGWVENTEEAIEALGELGDAKPPRDSNDMTGRFEGMFKHPYYIAGGPPGEYVQEGTGEPIGLFIPNFLISEGHENDKRGVVKERYSAPGWAQDLTPGDVNFHSNATSASPELKLTVPGKGYWKAGLSDIKVRVKNNETALGRFFGGIGDVLRTVTLLDVLNIGRGDDMVFRYHWKPNLHAFQKFNREGSYSDDFEWVWKRVSEGTGFNGSDFDWVQLPAIIDAPEYQTPENTFVGVPIVSNEVPEISDGLAGGFIEANQLPVFHPIDTEDYTNTTSPLKLNFGIDFFDFDSSEQFAGNQIKFHVLEWGDEDIKLSNEEILNSEFFALYNTNDANFDKSQAKKLLQIISNSKRHKSLSEISDGSSTNTLNFYQHTYTDSGVYSIKTVIFRMNSDETVLLETILMTTNIVVNDAGESLQDFNIFGASDFNVLPLRTDRDDQELIIGGVTEKSKYVKSVRRIERDDLYGQQDYLEKRYNERFLPIMEDSLYGDHPGKLDLATTRIFTKPYDLSYFIEPISEDENRSRATDILIDNTECIFELNPSEVDGNILESTGNSNLHSILIGDYKLIKEQNREIRKEDSMEIPKIETGINNQAF